MSLYSISPRKIKVIYNGIDTKKFKKVKTTSRISKFNIDFTKSYLLFVGRLTRQKGLTYFLDSLEHIKKEIDVVICAPASDEETAYPKEIMSKIEAQRKNGRHIVLIDTFKTADELVELYSHAGVFVCPSIYEPFGIINLEAMACELPVVASATGGIKEVVVDGATGYLVNFQTKSDIDLEPKYPAQYARMLARRINDLLDDDSLRKTFGQKGRARVLRKFSWEQIAEQTKNVYQNLLK